MPRRKKPLPPKLCEGKHCSVVFVPKQINTRFHSKLCAGQSRYVWHTPMERLCKKKSCKVRFMPKRNQMYHSTTCQNTDAKKRWRRRNPKKARARMQSWRAQNPGYDAKDMRRRQEQARLAEWNWLDEHWAHLWEDEDDGTARRSEHVDRSGSESLPAR